MLGAGRGIGLTVCRCRLYHRKHGTNARRRACNLVLLGAAADGLLQLSTGDLLDFNGSI